MLSKRNEHALDHLSIRVRLAEFGHNVDGVQAGVLSERVRDNFQGLTRDDRDKGKGEMLNTS